MAEANVPNYGSKGPVLKATVGENMTPETAAVAKDTIAQTAANAPGQDIKLPFVDAAISVPKGNMDQGGIGGGNGVYDQFKSFIEAPEKAGRSLTELVGATKPDSDTRVARYVVPSYAETAGKTTGQLIDEGVPPTAAIILASGASAGEFANDALMYEGMLASGARAVAVKAAVPAESELVAWDFLGRPKTIDEAESNWRAIQREYHPDITGSEKVSADANSAISILRKEGIPTTSRLNQAIDAITNRPLKDLFKGRDVPGGYKPETPIKGFLEGQAKSSAAKDVLTKEIKTYASAHGPDVARQALIDNIGVDARTADRLITEAIAARTPRQLAAAGRDLLAELAPEASAPAQGASRALQGFKVEGTTAKVKPEPVVKPAPAVKKPIKDSLTAYDTRAIIKARAEIAGKKPTHLIDTPKRKALRAKIIDDVYRKHAAKKGKRLDIVTGIPASGKSSNIVEPLAKEHQSLVVDSDEIKKLLPGYAKGKGAMAVHQESAVMNFDLIKKGLEGGDNMVYPTVGAGENALKNLIDLAHSKGYEIHLHNVDLAPEKAAARAVDRFKKTGRLVDPDYIMNKVGLRSHATHAIVKNNEKLTSVTRYDADVPKGRRYPVVEQGTPGDAARRGAEESERLGGGIHEREGNGGTGSLVEQAKKYPTAEDFVKSQTLVYHGSAEPLEGFNESGAFFTDDMMNAEGYAGGENVYEGYVDLKNPLVIDAKDAKWDELDTPYGKSTQAVVANMPKENDGVIFKNVKDSWIDDADAQDPGTIYYVANANKQFLNEEQLVDLYNKAHEAPSADAQTPRIAEETPPENVQPATIADTQVPIGVPMTGDFETPKLAERIQDRLGETFEGIEQYEKMDMKAEAKTAADMIETDYERLKRIAMNLEAAPPGLHAGTAYKAVEMKAVADGDRQTLLDLARSKTSKLASLYGQEIKAFDGRDPNSPVDAIAEINAIREERAAKRAKGKSVAEEKKATKTAIKAGIKKTATKETWASFVDSITC